MKTFKEWLLVKEGKDREHFRGKHSKDYNHGKHGYVAGNPRFNRKRGRELNYKGSENPQASRVAAKKDLQDKLDDLKDGE